MADKMQGKWTEPQLKYIQFLARGKKNRKGEQRTEEQFAEAIGVDFSTLWRWKQKDGFAEALLEATQRELAPLLPSLSNAVTGKAFGEKRFKNIDIPAATLAIKLMGVAERRAVKSEAEVQHSGRIGVDLTTKSDAELDAIINGVTA
jgi:transcriptional regulator with XRE-family HTH domain